MRSFRPLLLASSALAAAVAVAACGGSGPGWTYAPAPAITPPPSVEPSIEPSAGPSASVAASASVAPTGDLAVIDIAASGVLFDTDSLTAPADQPFQIVFANNDAGIPHNVEITDAGGAVLFAGDIFNGVETRTYDVPALAAGAYPFLCVVHPTTMVGTLTIGG